MTNELLTEETRRDRWVRLPYALMAMMVMIGGLSYFLDSRARSANTQSARERTDAFIKRRIAEHELAAKQPVVVAKQSATPKTAARVPIKFTQPVKANQASTISSVIQRINWRGKLAYLKSKPKWVIGGASIILLAGLVLFARRGRRQETVGLTGLLSMNETPAAIESKPEIAKQPVEEAVPCIFSLYATDEPVDEGSFIATYIKPTISSFVESLRSIVKRQKEEHDPMHTLIPAVMRSISTRPSMAAPELNSNGNLFRRAVLVRK
jgi:hypothetical protein